jgi:hypothetical protein
MQKEPLAQPCNHAFETWLYSIIYEYLLFDFCTSIEDLP